LKSPLVIDLKTAKTLGPRNAADAASSTDEVIE